MSETNGKENKPCKRVEVSICHINLLSDFLQILKKNDYKVLRKNGFNIEYTDGLLQEWIDDILTNFCKPLIEHDKDTEIILNQNNNKNTMENCKIEIETSYAPDTDITYILEETYINDECISTELKGFYYGEPNEEFTKQFFWKIKGRVLTENI